MAIPAVRAGLLRSAALVASGRARYLMAMLSAMVFARVAHSAMLVKSSVAIRSNSQANMGTATAFTAPDAVMMVNGAV